MRHVVLCKDAMGSDDDLIFDRREFIIARHWPSKNFLLSKFLPLLRFDTITTVTLCINGSLITRGPQALTVTLIP